MNESITIFHAKQTTSKLPISPFNDKTFIFETHQASTNLQMFSTMVSHFILNIPLSLLKKPVRTFRRKIHLEKFYDETISYLILDIDKVKSEFDKQKVLDYFKDYKVILGESKSYNGFDNFNMKGLLFTEDIDINYAKTALSVIGHDLQEWCEVDECVVRKATLNAPLLKNNIFINNEEGIRFKFVKQQAQDHINAIKKEYEGTSSKIDIGRISDLMSLEADSMDKLCLKVFQNMGYEAIKNNPNGSISFKHPTEKKTPGGYFWFSSSPYTMHHCNSTRTINIFDTIRKLPAAKELMKKEINYDDEFLKFNTDTSVTTVNEKYLKVTPAINDEIQEFLNNRNGLLSIRSPMGTGKSTLINHIIEECHHQDMKVLIITNRISVAEDFGKKYDIKVYNKDKYEIGDSLICQYDSLWRYNMKFFDIIVMDEFISLMLHSKSNLSKGSINIAKFFGSFNKKLVIADAFLTGYENFLLSNKTKNIHMINNEYRDPMSLYSYTDFNKFVDSIGVHAEKHKLTISSTSLSFINSLRLFLENKGLNVVTLTADTPESTKDIIYDLFDKEDHDKWDVLIYSPTLTVGVSNLNNVNYHFHYDSSMSSDVISSLQMIKRTRKAKEIHMYVKEKINYFKTSYDEIRDEYMGNIGKHLEQNYMFEIDNYGEARLSEIGKKGIKIDVFKNILEFNHKEAMLWLMKYHFFHTPRLIETKIAGTNVLNKYKRILKDDQNNLVVANIDQFLKLNDIEKTSLLMDDSADKNMKSIAEICECVNTNDSKIISEILNVALRDRSFIQKCKNYKTVYNYSIKEYNDSDIKNKISSAVIDGNSDLLHFYNMLLLFGQKQIIDEYNLGTINTNKKLKYILDKCGYAKTTVNNLSTVGKRSYEINQNVKKLYPLIK